MRRSLSEYAHTYRESAEQLMELACNAPGLLNVYAVPAVFLFRHHVELSLKSLLVDVGHMNDGPATFPRQFPAAPAVGRLLQSPD